MCKIIQENNSQNKVHFHNSNGIITETTQLHTHLFARHADFCLYQKLLNAKLQLNVKKSILNYNELVNFWFKQYMKHNYSLINKLNHG